MCGQLLHYSNSNSWMTNSWNSNSWKTNSWNSNSWKTNSWQDKLLTGKSPEETNSWKYKIFLRIKCDKIQKLYEKKTRKFSIKNFQTLVIKHASCSKVLQYDVKSVLLGYKQWEECNNYSGWNAYRAWIDDN